MEEFISKSCPDAEPPVKGSTGRDWPLFMWCRGKAMSRYLTGRLCLVYSFHRDQSKHARWRRRVDTPSCGISRLIKNGVCICGPQDGPSQWFRHSGSEFARV